MFFFARTDTPSVSSLYQLLKRLSPKKKKASSLFQISLLLLGLFLLRESFNCTKVSNLFWAEVEGLRVQLSELTSC